MLYLRYISLGFYEIFRISLLKKTAITCFPTERKEEQEVEYRSPDPRSH